jgi:NADPH2:quinone reductase
LFARTTGARSAAGSAAKATRARELGYHNVIDISAESIGDGVRRITNGAGADVVIESLGGA